MNLNQYMLMNIMLMKKECADIPLKCIFRKGHFVRKKIHNLRK